MLHWIPPMPSTASVLDLLAVTKRFTAPDGVSALTAIDRVTFEVRRGEFVAIVGPSGCGKSTILNLIAGLLRPSEGSVKYDGTEVTRPNVRVGYMTQKDTLLPWRNVRDNVGLALELRIRSTARAEATAR